jgi:hypothetical protein
MWITKPAKKLAFCFWVTFGVTNRSCLPYNPAMQSLKTIGLSTKTFRQLEKFAQERRVKIAFVVEPTIMAGLAAQREAEKEFGVAPIYQRTNFKALAAQQPAAAQSGPASPGSTSNLYEV